MTQALEVAASFDHVAGMARVVSAMSKDITSIAVRAVNHTGAKAKTQMVRALTKQTGLSRQIVVKALRSTNASAASPVFAVRSKGGDISLRYFGARETTKGVSAAPNGSRQVFAGTFMKGGRFPDRVDLSKLNGQVYKREGSTRLPITKVRSGVFLPREMVEGATAAAFYDVVRADLPDRLKYELLRSMAAA